MIPAHMWPRLLWQWGKPILMHHLWTFGGALHWILNRVAVVTCPFLEPIPAPMLISELNRDQISLMGDIICGQININMWTTSVKGKLEKIMFYFFSLFIWLVGVAGEKSGALEWVHVTYSYLSTSPAGKDWIHQNMFHGNHENTEKAAMPNKGFFAAASRVELSQLIPGRILCEHVALL